MNDNKLYKISEILEMGIFPLTYRTLLRKMQDGEIKTIKMGCNKKGTKPRYFVRGKDLNDYYNKLIK